VGASDNFGNVWHESYINPLAPCCDGGCSHGEGVCGSNYGTWIDVVAPGGVQLGKTTDTGVVGYDCNFGGTSASAPVVAGVAALLKGAVPSLTGEDIQQVLNRTAQDVNQGGNEAGYDIHTGYGIVRADRALKYVTTPRLVQQKLLHNLTVEEVVSGA